MAIRGAARPLVVVALLVLMGACARPGTATPDPTADPDPGVALPADGDALVLRAEHVGGFATPEMLAARVPVVSVYADGRVITEGPVVAVYPGPALPNVQVHRIEPARVRDLAERALAAGVAETTDLGTPPIADATSLRFTLVTEDSTHVREVYALQEGPRPGTGPEPGDALSAEQQAAREELRALLDELMDVSPSRGDVPAAGWGYEPQALAAVVRPWTDPADGLDHAPAPWPGPPLPGEPLGSLPDQTCVVATGEQTTALLAAARDADALTPWITDDGARWSVTFRPLLPDEESCADLLQ